MRERDEQVQDLADPTRNSKFILNPLRSHANDHPQLIGRAIQEVLEAASKGAPLKQERRAILAHEAANTGSSHITGIWNASPEQ